MNKTLAVYSSSIGADQQNLPNLSSDSSSRTENHPEEQSPARPKYSHAVAVLLFTGLCVFFWFSLPNWGFVSRGEAREGLVVRAMETQQNLILPMRNGVDIPSKPPLFHWQAVGMKTLLSGLPEKTEEFAIRLPSAFAAAALVTLLYCFAAPLLGTSGALLACFFLFSSIDFLRTAIVARVDMTFALWVSASTMALITVVSQFATTGKKNLFALFLATASAVFGIWTKGPAALAFPWCIAGISMLVLVPLRKIPWKEAIVSNLLTLGFSSIWYILAYKQGGQAFLDVHLMRENLARVVGMNKYSTGHSGAFYLPTLLLLLGTLPMSLFFPFLLKGLPAKVKGFRRDTLTTLQATQITCVVWATFIPLFFSLTASQRSVYLLPCFPAWAFLTASLFRNSADKRSDLPRLSSRLSRTLRSSYLLVGTLFLLAFVALFVPSVIQHLPLKDADKTIAEVVRKGILHSPFSLFLFLLIPITAITSWKKGDSWGLLRIVSVIGILNLLFQQALMFSVLPATAAATHPLPFAERVREFSENEKIPLYQYDDDFYSLNYYLGADLPRLNSGQAAPIGKSYLLLKTQQRGEALKQFPDLKEILVSESYDVYGKDHFLLAEINGISNANPLETQEQSSPGMTPLEDSANTE